MKIFQGDCGGILLRSSYYFAICQQGAYAFGSYQNNTWSVLINHQSSSAIRQGLDQTNLVAVVASGYNVDLYINHQKINNVNTGTDQQGPIGVYASSTYGNATQVMFSNLKVWT